MNPLSDKIGISLPPTFSSIDRALPRQGYLDEIGSLLHLQAQIYVHRSADLWKEPGVLAWLQSVIADTHSRLSNPDDPDVKTGTRLLRNTVVEHVTHGIYRTVLLSGQMKA